MAKASGIYAILPADLEMADLLFKAEAALKGGIRILQFRDKKQGYKRAIKRAKALRELTHRYEAMLFINDSANLAVAAGADGVHLGRDDLSDLAELRNQVGESLIVGVTCRADVAYAKAVLNDGADYVSFGAVWATTTKPEVPTLGLARLAKTRQLLPDANICAIGGITADNVVQVKAAGADCAAVISGLFADEDIESKARLLTEMWKLA